MSTGAIEAGARLVRREAAGRRRRRLRASAALAAVVLALAAVSLTVGGYDTSVPDVVRTLLGRGEGIEEFVVLELRLPRLLLGALVGIALALAGALFQSTLANPLASPDIIGVTAGASAGAVSALLVLDLSGVAVSAAAFVAAMVVATAIYLLSYRDGITGERFVLIGVGVGFMATSLLCFLLTRADVRDVRTAFVWISGSLGGASWSEVTILAVATAVLVPLAALAATRLRALELGDDAATGLGLRPQRARLALIVIGVALTAVATASAGPIAFVALMSGPIARWLTGDGGPALVPAALVGAAIVTSADLVGGNLLGDVQVPVGVITGAVGAPYLMVLLASIGRRGGA